MNEGVAVVGFHLGRGIWGYDTLTSNHASKRCVYGGFGIGFPFFFLFFLFFPEEGEGEGFEMYMDELSRNWNGR